jgi:hypothetical protein
MPRVKVIESIELKVKKEPVINTKVNKINKIDLLLDNLSIDKIDNINIIIKKELQLSSVIRFFKLKKV